MFFSSIPKYIYRQKNTNKKNNTKKNYLSNKIHLMNYFLKIKRVLHIHFTSTNICRWLIRLLFPIKKSNYNNIKKKIIHIMQQDITYMKKNNNKKILKKQWIYNELKRYSRTIDKCLSLYHVIFLKLQNINSFF